MLAQLLPLFIAGVLLTALSCALYLIGLGLYLWLMCLLYKQELMAVDGDTQKDSLSLLPEASEQL